MAVMGRAVIWRIARERAAMHIGLLDAGMLGLRGQCLIIADDAILSEDFD